MTVERILASKGHEVVTIELDRTVGEAAKMLADRRIGAVVVVDASGGIVGILSERDVVRALATRADEALHAPVSDYLTRKLVTCTAQSSIDSLMRLMTDGKFRHVPVVEGGKLGGIVSIGDIVKHRLAEMEAEGQALREYIATA